MKADTIWYLENIIDDRTKTHGECQNKSTIRLLFHGIYFEDNPILFSVLFQVLWHPNEARHGDFRNLIAFSPSVVKYWQDTGNRSSNLSGKFKTFYYSLKNISHLSATKKLKDKQIRHCPFLFLQSFSNQPFVIAGLARGSPPWLGRLQTTAFGRDESGFLHIHNDCTRINSQYKWTLYFKSTCLLP